MWIINDGNQNISFNINTRVHLHLIHDLSYCQNKIHRYNKTKYEFEKQCQWIKAARVELNFNWVTSLVICKKYAWNQ